MSLLNTSSIKTQFGSDELVEPASSGTGGGKSAPVVAVCVPSLELGGADG